MMRNYSGLNLNQDKATKPQTVQIVRQGEATPYWFKFNPLYWASPYYIYLMMRMCSIIPPDRVALKEKAESLFSSSAILTVRDGLKFYRRYWAESVFRRLIVRQITFSLNSGFLSIKPSIGA